MSNKPARRSPKIWSGEATIAFLRCTAEAYQSVGTNKKCVHKKITPALNLLLTGVPNEPEVTKEQVRHKYDSYRKQWMQWQSLCNKTGAGWDPVKRTVTGTNEWWTDRVKEFGPNILKYKKGPIEEMEMLHIIFEGTHATGEGAFTPATTQQTTQTTQTTQTQFDQAWAYDLNEDYHELHSQPPVSPFAGPSAIPSVPPFAGSSFNSPPQYTGTSVIPHTHASSSEGKGRSRRHRTDTEDKLNEIIDALHEKHISKKSRSSTASPVTPNSVESTSHATSLDFISRVKKFNEIPLAQALAFLRLKENREIFEQVDNDTAREWLKIELEREKINLDYKQYVMKKGNPNE